MVRRIRISVCRRSASFFFFVARMERSVIREGVKARDRPRISLRSIRATEFGSAKRACEGEDEPHPRNPFAAGFSRFTWLEFANLGREGKSENGSSLRALAKQSRSTCWRRGTGCFHLRAPRFGGLKPSEARGASVGGSSLRSSQCRRRSSAPSALARGGMKGAPREREGLSGPTTCRSGRSKCSIGRKLHSRYEKPKPKG